MFTLFIARPVPEEAPDGWPLLVLALGAPKGLIAIVNKTEYVVPGELENALW
jgi:hypothetical protein